MTSKNVSITLMASGDAQCLVQAIQADNPLATLFRLPSVVKIDCPDRLVVKSDTVSEKLGRPWDPQELHLSLVTISGRIEQDEDAFVLSWR